MSLYDRWCDLTTKLITEDDTAATLITDGKSPLYEHLTDPEFWGEILEYGLNYGGTCGPILRCIADKLDFDEPRNPCVTGRPVVEVLRDCADQIDQAERALDEVGDVIGNEVDA